MNTFDDLPLASAILRAVREQGYICPTPIQQQAIPAILQGADLLAGSQTGTGKTAAFILPLLHLLHQKGHHTGLGCMPRALILTPTRELAAQIHESAQVYGKYTLLRSVVVFGGVGQAPQIKALQAGVDLLVATPGRLLDLCQQGLLDLAHVGYLVLDEADRMLDMGFLHDVKKILALLPKPKQSLLFSATFSPEIRALATHFLHQPTQIQVTPANTTAQRIEQMIHPVARDKKCALLTHLIQQNQWQHVLVFTRTKHGANQVATHLNAQGIRALALHGNKSQGARVQALDDFKQGGLQVLVATDLAARGLDIDDLPHVVNYDIPNVPEDYVHRIGRTGRAGSSGSAVNLVSLDEEGFMLNIEQFTQQTMSIHPIAAFMPDETEIAEPIIMGRQVLWGGAGNPPSRAVMQAAAKVARTQLS